ncbi:MAG: hypothetical protein ABIR32_07005, partial [Ilumatobacteraceae bacterium]
MTPVAQTRRVMSGSAPVVALSFGMAHCALSRVRPFSDESDDLDEAVEPAKSSGFLVYSGRFAAHAAAAISRSTAA